MNAFFGKVIVVALTIGMAAAAQADDRNLWMSDTGMAPMYVMPDVGAPTTALPLVSISLGARSQVVNSYSLDVTAVLNTWSVGDKYEPVYSPHRIDFAVQPGQKDTFVLQTLELKDTVSPQALLDKMLIDGALTLNVVW